MRRYRGIVRHGVHVALTKHRYPGRLSCNPAKHIAFGEIRRYDRGRREGVPREIGRIVQLRPSRLHRGGETSTALRK
jgi:hypothetical protein